MEEVLRSLQEVDPLWAVALVALALAILLVAKFWTVSFARFVAVAAILLVVGGLAAAGYFTFRHLEDTRRLEERRALDERAKLLFDQAVKPDSVFACIDGSPVPAVQDACERNLFAEPQRVAAAVTIVTQRLAFLADALAFVEKLDSDYSGRVEPLRKSIEADPYGFVAFVLSVEHGCAAEACARFSLFRSPERVRENMRVRRLEAFLARYSAAWQGPGPRETAGAAPAGRSIAPLVTISSDELPKAAAEAAQSALPQAATAPETSAPVAGIQISDPPAAALAPVITPPVDAEVFSGPQRTATQPESAPAAAAPSAPPNSAAAKSAPKGTPQAKSKAKAAVESPVSRRSNEPVAGLPRVVPRDYIREKEEEKEDAKAQASGQQPGAPMSISSPAQNFNGR